MNQTAWSASLKGPTHCDHPAMVNGRTQPPIRNGIVLSEQIGNTDSTEYLFAQPEVTDSDDTLATLDDLLSNLITLVTRSNEKLEMSERM